MAKQYEQSERVLSTTDRIEKIIRCFIAKHGYPPTVREIGALAEISSSSVVQSYLRRLEEDGVIQRVRGRARAIVLVERGKHR